MEVEQHSYYEEQEEGGGGTVSTRRRSMPRSSGTKMRSRVRRSSSSRQQ